MGDGHRSSDRDPDHRGSPGPDHRSGPDPDHREHLDRSRRKWDFWSKYYDFNERDTEPIRRNAIEQLRLEPGDAVLDLGCGPGVNFEMVRERVGPEGRILGVDYSPEMLARARGRIDDAGWDNVEVVRADATGVGLEPAAFDAALATQSLSVMPDVRAAVEVVHDALTADGRFGVYGLRLIPSGPGRLLNPLIARVYRYVGNRNEEADVLDELRTAFDDVEVVATYALGTSYVAAASKRPDAE